MSLLLLNHIVVSPIIVSSLRAIFILGIFDLPYTWASYNQEWELGVGCRGGSHAPVHSAESSWPGCLLRCFLSNPFTLCSLQRGPLGLRNSAALASDTFTEIRQVVKSVDSIILLLKNTHSAHVHFYRTCTMHTKIIKHVQKNIEKDLHQTVNDVFHIRVGLVMAGGLHFGTYTL